MIQDIRILSVEDNEAHAKLIQRLLEEACEVDPLIHHVSTLAESLEALGSEDFDIVLLDLNLPDSQGLETLTRLRLRAPAAPVVIMSAIQDRELALYAVRDGAQDYLVKEGLQSEHLVRSVAYALERSRLQREIRLTYANLEEKSRELSRTLTDMRAFERIYSRDVQLQATVIQQYAIQLESALRPLNHELGLSLVTGIHAASARLAAMIHRVGRFAHHSAQESVLEAEQLRDGLDLGKVVEDATVLLLPEIEEAEVAVTTGDLGATTAEPTSLNELFVTLLSHQLEHHSADSVSRIAIERLTSEAEPDVPPGFAMFAMGAWDVSAGELQFEWPKTSEYQQEASADTDVALRTCRSIVQRHGGSFWVHSTPHENFHYRFTLPIDSGE